MISYCIIMSIILLLVVFVALIKTNIIMKNTVISSFIKSDTFTYIINRILLSLLSIFIVLVAVFLLMRMAPKNYLNNYNDSLTNHAYINNYSSSNIFKDFLYYMYNILPFPKRVCVASSLKNGSLVCGKYSYKIIDLGYSYFYMKNVSVWTIIKQKSSVSFLVGSIAYFFQCLIGYPLGIYIAKRKNKLVDKSVNLLNTIISSIPEILYFYLFLIIFMVVFKLPVSFEIHNFASYLAPISALVLFGSCLTAYWVKRYILLESNKDYVKFALSKGIDENTIFYKHIIRNALIPLIRTMPTSLAACICGYHLIEATFNIPGIGYTLITAINLQDIYLVQGLILFFSTFSVLSYLLGDLISVIFDKRISFREVAKHEE